MEFRHLNLTSLHLLQFKNYLTAEVKFTGGFNCIVGDNGSGKTNLLDAIHYLTWCKSYFNPVDSQHVLDGTDSFMIKGRFYAEVHEEEVFCSVKKNQKKVFRRNNKDYGRLADHIGLLPSVMISPYDIELVLEGSEVRRKFVDSVISQYSRPYLNDLIQYNHALMQRNNLLKTMARQGSFNWEALEPWNMQLSEKGTRIYLEREKFVKAFVPAFEESYYEVSGGKEQPVLHYQSDLQNEAAANLLEKNREKDRLLERTTSGIHKDELEFMLGKFPLKRYGSQGQQKTYLIALKLAQFTFIQKSLGITPILMLDDVFDKMDEKRTALLMNLLSGDRFGQVFITDTHPERIPSMLAASGIDHSYYNVANGIVTYQFQPA